MALKVNSVAPNFELPSTNGNKISLENDLKGKPCVIYFYPKDFTPGCTKEACEFRDQFATFRNLDIDVFGISRDNVETHIKFKDQHKLPFELLSDVDGKVCKAYEALIPIVGVPKRISYLLDKEHKIVAVYQDFFGAEDHIKEMLKKIQTV
ncbi:MAG: peroxiredoxin [Raineya sp.]|jgi:peroxiredoxin Q/BCP|nr:peroxiredoxin [Raineya sp.]